MLSCLQQAVAHGNAIHRIAASVDTGSEWIDRA